MPVYTVFTERISTMRALVVMLLALSLGGATLANAQKNRVARQSTSIVGEYRDVSESGLTFNIERNKRTRNYHLWIGGMGSSSMNYHVADATGLQLDDRTGALVFSYTDDDGGEQCSFSGTVKAGKIMGQHICAKNGQRETKQVTLKKFR